MVTGLQDNQHVEQKKSRQASLAFTPIARANTACRSMVCRGGIKDLLTSAAGMIALLELRGSSDFQGSTTMLENGSLHVEV